MKPTRFARPRAALARWTSTASTIVRADVAMFRRHPRLFAIALGAVLVPVLYAVIYLSSVWDPYGRLRDLPVAAVTRDAGTQVEGRAVNLGERVVHGVETSGRARIVRYSREEDAMAAVRRGEVSFALLVPREFSEQAVHPGVHGASLRVYVSEGNSSMAAMIARRFAADVARQANEALARERWRAVISTVDTSSQRLGTLRDAVHALHDGATRIDDGLARAADGSARLASGTERARVGAGSLADGSGQVSRGTGALAHGVQQLGDGLRTMQSRMPADTDLVRLRDGAHAVSTGASQLADGNARLASGAAQLANGTTRLAEGTTQLRHGVARIPIFGGRAADGAGRIESGARQVDGGARRLADGALRAADGSARLSDGAARVDDGVSRLANGMQQVHGGVDRMVAALPADDRLDALADGSARVANGTASLRQGIARIDQGTDRLAAGLGTLHDGSIRLANGLGQLEGALPHEVRAPEGTPDSLAVSVESAVVTVAPVVSNGAGFVPYFVPIALWVGAVMTAFLFHLRRVPASLADGPKTAVWAGKLAIPSVLVLAQALAVGIAVRRGLGVSVPNVWQYALTLALASLVFVRLVVMLQRLLGDAGKGVALIVLVVQLASAGGPYPIELEPRPFRALHPFLPFTQVLEALRATLFHAYDGNWIAPTLRLAGMGAAVIATGALVGRWRSVADGDYGPAVDV